MATFTSATNEHRCHCGRQYPEEHIAEYIHAQVHFKLECNFRILFFYHLSKLHIHMRTQAHNI
jgi:hypothetical protein